jgi:hypothetical protein
MLVYLDSARLKGLVIDKEHHKMKPTTGSAFDQTQTSTLQQQTQESTHDTDPSCQSCVELLKKILFETPDSRSSILLRALTQTAWKDGRPSLSISTTNTADAEEAKNDGDTSRIHWQSTPQGIVIEIPSQDPNAVLRPWSKLQEDEPVDHQQPINNNASRINNSDNSSINDSSLFQKASQYFMLAATSPIVAKDHLHVTCRPCSSAGPEGHARAFLLGPDPLEIVICTNRFVHAADHPAAQHELDEILTHELTHAYDAQARHLNLRDCESLAYAEVRAAQFAECFGSYFSKPCVARTALSATSTLFPPEQARVCLHQVLDRAMQDKRPFEATSVANDAANRAPVASLFGMRASDNQQETTGPSSDAEAS